MYNSKGYIKPRVKQMEDQKELICIPLRTIHNIIPVLDSAGEHEIRVLLESEFIDISDFEWIYKIFKRAKELKGIKVHYVIVGHPLVNLVAVNAISKFASELKIYAWNRATKKYVGINYSDLFVYGEEN
jgi:hypothetical protein